MSSTNIEQVMPVKLAQALANPLFPALDSALRSGRHIGLDELDNHAFLMDFQEYLEEFYARYNVELIRAPECRVQNQTSAAGSWSGGTRISVTVSACTSL